MAENTEAKSTITKDTVTIGKDSIYVAGIVLLACLIALSILTQGFGLAKPAAVACPACNSTCPSGSMGIGVGSFQALGQASAPVTIVQFSDFQCPYCGALFSGAEASIRANYVNSGKVKIYFRNYPLSFHPNALPGAIAAGCAAEQNQFWAMHDKLFSNQGTWSEASDPTPYFYQYASAIGLDNASFASCIAKQTPLGLIQADQADGSSYGVQGTPASFVIVPKSDISNATISAAVDSLNQQYGAGALSLSANSGYYIVFITGAYPYSAFDALLSKVSY